MPFSNLISGEKRFAPFFVLVQNLLLLATAPLQLKQAMLVYAVGFLLTLAQPPYFFLPLAFLSCGLWLHWLNTAPSLRRAWWISWWFGFGYFSTGLYWFAYPLLIDAARYGVLIPFAIAGIGGALALMYALAGLFYKKITKGFRPYAAWLAFMLIVGITEYVRGHLFTGFPWNLLAYVWTVHDSTIQFFAYSGAYALTALSWGFFTLPVLWWPLHSGSSQRPHVLYVLLIACTAAWTAGAARVYLAEDAVVPGVRLRIVQGNIPQSMKWQPQMRMEAIRRYAAYSMVDGYEGITHIIWPETAMTYPFDSGDHWAQELAGVLLPHQKLLTGVVRIAHDPVSGDERYYNSLQVLGADAKVEASYDKVHLVPFGEYIPLRQWIPLTKLTYGTQDFSAGSPHALITLAKTPPFRTIICYESIFPELAAGEGAQWLLNITNDAWFGDSVAPYQLLAMSRARAVETGLPLVRAANTGISAVIDPYGRVLRQLGLDEEGSFDAELPVPIINHKGYNLYENLFFLMFALGCVLCIFEHKRT